MKPIRNAILALVALIIALGAAYGLDDAVIVLIQTSKQTLDFRFTLWLLGLVLMVYTAGLLALAGWLLTRATCPRVIDVIYVLVGVVAVFLIPLIFAFQLNIPVYPLGQNGPITFWSMTGAVLAAAGLLHLFRPRPVA